MKTKSLAAAVLFGLLSVTVVRADQSGWQTYKLPSGKFEVLLPGTPMEQKETQKTPFGNQEIRMAVAFDVEKQIGYIAGSIEMPALLKNQLGNGDQAFDALAQGFVSGVQGKLVSKKKVMVAGYPGLELKATMADGQGELHGRLCIVDGHVYIMAVMCPKDGLDAKGAVRFFQSFRPVAVIAARP